MTQPRSTLADFDSFEQIGSGSFGVVYRVRRKLDGRIYALKQVALSSHAQYTETVKEINILASLNHNHIVRYYDCFSSDGDTKLNIVMEYAKHGTLHDMIKARNGHLLSEADIWRYFYHMLLALHHVHTKKILHRDIKAMNVFLDEKLDCKLGDFGVSKILDKPQEMTGTIIGTPLYMSPELCRNTKYDSRSDVWALGCILYEMCTLVHPFEHAIADYIRNPMALAQAVMNGSWDRGIIQKHYSPEMCTVLEQCLAVEPHNRPTAQQLLDSPMVLNRLMHFNIIPRKPIEKKDEWVLLDQDGVKSPPTPKHVQQQQPQQPRPISHMPVMQPARITPIPAPQRPQYYNNQPQPVVYPQPVHQQPVVQQNQYYQPSYVVPPSQPIQQPYVPSVQQQSPPFGQPAPQHYVNQHHVQRVTPPPQVYQQAPPQVSKKTELCPFCQGKKVTNSGPCGACQGQGFIYYD